MRHVAKAFQGRVKVDGNEYVDCSFRGATLVYAGGPPPSFTGCDFEGFDMAFEGAAENTLALLLAMAEPDSGMADVIRRTFPKLYSH